MAIILSILHLQRAQQQIINLHNISVSFPRWENTEMFSDLLKATQLRSDSSGFWICSFFILSHPYRLMVVLTLSDHGWHFAYSKTSASRSRKGQSGYREEWKWPNGSEMTCVWGHRRRRLGIVISHPPPVYLGKGTLCQWRWDTVSANRPGSPCVRASRVAQHCTRQQGDNYRNCLSCSVWKAMCEAGEPLGS